MEFWDLFVLQWHGVLLSAGAFGGEAAHIGSQVAVAEQPAVENNKGLFYLFYSFRRNIRHLSAQFWRWIVLQWHGVLLSAGAFVAGAVHK